MCGTQDKNARDVLMHLHDWHNMLLEWYKNNTSGNKTTFLPDGYTWRTTPELNNDLWKSYQDVSLQEAKELFKKSHQEVMDIINSHDNDELFAKGRFSWTGTTSLGAYLVSATSSHYEWAAKQLKRRRLA